MCHRPCTSSCHKLFRADITRVRLWSDDGNDDERQEESEQEIKQASNAFGVLALCICRVRVYHKCACRYGITTCRCKLKNICMIVSIASKVHNE